MVILIFIKMNKTVSLTSPPFFVFNILIYRYRLFPTVLLSYAYFKHTERSEQSAATRRLVAVFVGDEDYFYSVLVTLMSHYDIIVANPVGA